MTEVRLRPINPASEPYVQLPTPHTARPLHKLCTIILVKILYLDSSHTTIGTVLQLSYKVYTNISPEKKRRVGGIYFSS